MNANNMNAIIADLLSQGWTHTGQPYGASVALKDNYRVIGLDNGSIPAPLQWAVYDSREPLTNGQATPVAVGEFVEDGSVVDLMHHVYVGSNAVPVLVVTGTAAQTATALAGLAVQKVP